MSNSKNMNALSDADLNQVSGGAVGPDPNWYAINGKHLEYGSPEYINYCKEHNLDPNLSWDEINSRQNAIWEKNKRMSNKF